MKKWDITGQKVVAMYLNTFPCYGVVVDSRIKYGGEPSYMVNLVTPIEVYGNMRDRITIEPDEIIGIE